MPERYSGTKFKTIFKERREIAKGQDNELTWQIEDLIRWCEVFSKSGLAPRCEGGYAGNLSIRTSDGFIITAAGSNLASITKEQFTEVSGVDIFKKEVTASGLKEPSSESFIHHEIYKIRDDVNAVFHGHDSLVLRHNDKLKIPITEKEKAYGTIELMSEVINVLNKNISVNYILIKNHGFISIGKSMDEAGEVALKKHREALGFSGV